MSARDGLEHVLAHEVVPLLAVIVVGAVGALAEQSHALSGAAGDLLVPGVLAHVDGHASLGNTKGGLCVNRQIL